MYLTFIYRSWDNLVGIAMDYGLKGQGSIPSRGKKLFLFSPLSILALEPTQPPMQCVPGALSPRVKWPGHEADHTSASSAEIRNGGTIPPLLSTHSWHGT
jgi:hypothetical protein